MKIRSRAFLVPLALAAGLLALGACGSGDDASKVASLDNSSAPASAAATGDVDKEVTAYVECLRKQGVDLPDPTVDAKGQVTFGRPTGGQTIDRDKMTAAQKVCGEPPAGITSAAQNAADDPAFQDAAVKFAECMRGQGVNVPDPDFSKTATGGAGGLFGNIDRDDPKVAAAVQSCQHVWTDAGVQPRGGGN